eukprot:TRINITY_DN6626_c0_g1_i1.p1 TRINITY_DN6626_c0_g1~~TRINITY_DN6626_c0_g1_i1.p1  ORF type:complete len:101 (-),score=15.27 TRINITY_DN6626_c0_g1_i1:298-600(-)
MQSAQLKKQYKILHSTLPQNSVTLFSKQTNNQYNKMSSLTLGLTVTAVSSVDGSGGLLDPTGGRVITGPGSQQTTLGGSTSGSHTVIVSSTSDTVVMTGN